MVEFSDFNPISVGQNPPQRDPFNKPLSVNFQLTKSPSNKFKKIPNVKILNPQPFNIVNDSRGSILTLSTKQPFGITKDKRGQVCVFPATGYTFEYIPSVHQFQLHIVVTDSRTGKARSGTDYKRSMSLDEAIEFIREVQKQNKNSFEADKILNKAANDIKRYGTAYPNIETDLDPKTGNTLSAIKINIPDTSLQVEYLYREISGEKIEQLYIRVFVKDQYINLTGKEDLNDAAEKTIGYLPKIKLDAKDKNKGEKLIKELRNKLILYLAK